MSVRWVGFLRTVHYTCDGTGYTRVDATRPSVGARRPEARDRCTSVGLRRARARIEEQCAPDGLGALLPNILRVIVDH